MGSADVRAYSRNKRGVAGSLIWINFDRHALLSVFRKARGRFLASKDEIRPQFRTDETAALDQTAIFNSSLTRTVGGGAAATIDQLDNISLNEVSGFKELAAPWYSDQKEGGSGNTRSVHPAGPEPPSRARDLKHQLTTQCQHQQAGLETRLVVYMGSSGGRNRPPWQAENSPKIVLPTSKLRSAFFGSRARK